MKLFKEWQKEFKLMELFLQKWVKNSEDSIVIYSNISSKPLKKTKPIIAQEKITILKFKLSRILC